MNALPGLTEFAAASAGAPLEAGEFRDIAAMMMREARISLPPQKATLVRSRLARRLREHGLPSYRAYIELVQRDPLERQAMVEALTTNHTHFFREIHHFDHLRDTLIPELKARTGHEPIRIWSSACSSGEEVYSIAMTLLGRDRREAQWAETSDLRLLATDISMEMVQATRAASYSPQAAEAVPAAYRAMWTRPCGKGFRIAEEAAALVSAMQLNLFDEWPMRRRFDAIFCRNVMIYFDDETKMELERRLIDQLLPGGYLYIGHSERLLGVGRDFMEPCGQTIYRKPVGMEAAAR